MTPVLRATWRILGVGCTAAAATVLLAWLLGRVLSDRFSWSQWLLWVPTPAAAAAVTMGLLGACRPAGLAAGGE